MRDLSPLSTRSIGHSTSFPGLEQLPDGGRAILLLPWGGAAR